MINPGILAQADRYREAVDKADPFSHVVMEDFFTAEAMESLHREFPAFEAVAPSMSSARSPEGR